MTSLAVGNRPITDLTVLTSGELYLNYVQRLQAATQALTTDPNAVTRAIYAAVNFGVVLHSRDPNRVLYETQDLMRPVAELFEAAASAADELTGLILNGVKVSMTDWTSTPPLGDPAKILFLASVGLGRTPIFASMLSICAPLSNDIAQDPTLVPRYFGAVAGYVECRISNDATEIDTLQGTLRELLETNPELPAAAHSFTLDCFNRVDRIRGSDAASGDLGSGKLPGGHHAPQERFISDLFSIDGVIRNLEAEKDPARLLEGFQLACRIAQHEPDLRDKALAAAIHAGTCLEEIDPWRRFHNICDMRDALEAVYVCGSGALDVTSLQNWREDIASISRRVGAENSLAELEERISSLPQHLAEAAKKLKVAIRWPARTRFMALVLGFSPEPPGLFAFHVGSQMNVDLITVSSDDWEIGEKTKMRAWASLVHANEALIVLFEKGTVEISASLIGRGEVSLPSANGVVSLSYADCAKDFLDLAINSWSLLVNEGKQYAKGRNDDWANELVLALEAVDGRWKIILDRGMKILAQRN